MTRAQCPLLPLSGHRAWKRLKAAADGYDRLHGCAPRCAHARDEQTKRYDGAEFSPEKNEYVGSHAQRRCARQSIAQRRQRKNHGAESTNYRDLNPPDADKDKAAEDQGQNVITIIAP